MRSNPSRRSFLKTTAVLSGGAMLFPHVAPVERCLAGDVKSPNERPRVGCIGVGGMGTGDAHSINRYGDILAVCDIDQDHAMKAKNDDKIGKHKADVYEDYRKLLDRNDIDVVTISTPDHWHTRISLAAMKAGKDVHCQKPLTLTIDEGKILCKAVTDSKKVFQVGTQQRSEDGNKFLKAVAMVQGGRIGKVKRVICSIGDGPTSKVLHTSPVPPQLNWEMWLGQAPKVDYIKERCHYEFRWWYEYSGGKLTDWGAHHVDIAQWAIGMDHSGPRSVEAVSVPSSGAFPTRLSYRRQPVQHGGNFPGALPVSKRRRAPHPGRERRSPPRARWEASTRERHHLRR